MYIKQSFSNNRYPEIHMCVSFNKPQSVGFQHEMKEGLFTRTGFYNPPAIGVRIPSPRCQEPRHGPHKSPRIN